MVFDLNLPENHKVLQKVLPRWTPFSNLGLLQVDQQRQALIASGGKPPVGEKQLAPVLDNSIGWGSFVAVSSNCRYQLVNGIEERGLVRSLNPGFRFHS